MGRREAVALVMLSLCSLFISPLYAYAAGKAGDWDIPAEIRRLYREAPSLAAFPGVGGVVWMDSRDYSLGADGAKNVVHKYLLLIGDASPDGVMSYRIPFPEARGSAVNVKEASLRDPSTGERIADLVRESYGGDGIEGETVLFPRSAAGKVAAIETSVSVPGRYYMDDALTLAGDLPVWEQRIAVEIPEGMNLYWEGFGVMEPEREKGLGSERVTWTVMNQPVWRNLGVVDERRPAMIFSLQRGLMIHLKNLRDMEMSFRAPHLPSAVSSSKGNVNRAAASVAKHMSARLMALDAGGRNRVRESGFVTPDGPWTAWEQVLIASKWMAAMGFDARLFWVPQLPVSSEGPTSSSLWREPVLRVADGRGGEIFFKSPMGTDAKKLPPSLYGATVYRSNGTSLERMTLPRGSASDHQLSQMWRLSLDEMGVATGTLDLTATGAWLDAFSLGGEPTAESVGRALLGNMRFNMPGLSIEPASLKTLSSGYRVNFSVRAALGIAAGNDMLFRIPGGVPGCFMDIPIDGTKYSFKFPFVFEQNSVISTPKNYRVLSLPGKIQNGDSKAMLDESVTHWTKRGQAEAVSRWTVRASDIDEYLAGRVSQQVDIVARWSELTVPLRK
ncbi:MAG: hypothetical protein LBS75_09155 [Synergistaceae bacterium]|jgi:hypothetical protein|nr:hypothetical protein [Synergistaceae bacterium]